MILNVASFNIKNNQDNRNGGLRKDGLDNIQIISNVIKDEKIDIIGTQELTINITSRLKNFLKGYKFYGKYRYGNKLFLRMPFNENNQIITNQKVIYSHTKHLPFLPKSFKVFKEIIFKQSFAPRIATIILIELKNKERIIVINTHLETRIHDLQVKQLKELEKMVTKYSKKYPVILTGDFNLEFKDEIFKKFVNNLKELGIIKIEINNSTWKSKSGYGKEEDHIFIPNYFEVKSIKLIDSLSASDHYGVVAKIKL